MMQLLAHKSCVVHPGGPRHRHPRPWPGIPVFVFMCESRFPQRVTAFAAQTPVLQDGDMDCWRDLKKRFDPTNPEAW